MSGALAGLVGRAALAPLVKALPALGETERAALEAGTVGFEGQLFAGRPDFNALLAVPPTRLTPFEQAFVDQQVSRLCAMLHDHAIDEAGDLPEPVWEFLRQQRFFGMIIPPEFGGLGFGHAAHAAVVTRIATANVAAAVTVMVPNSLGPAELLLRYGTPEQRQHYLPRLADGRELPCFALTSPHAGSDAASIPDRGVLVEREIDGRRVRGFVVNFDKRYITLAPVATVVGLAFQAVDDSRPEGQRDLGITCALIPVPQAGMQIGRRHRPMNSAFMNGPVRGQDVFVPMDWVIGGESQVGQGWRMLMQCLAAGRAISLPALGAALQQGSLFVANGYGQIREQFGLPIGKFHAVAGVVARMAAELYATDAARRYTAAALDAGEQPSVASAILKVHLTEAGRRAVNHGMDILGGKGIIAGPSNLLGIAYRHAPIAITVEGANILTRALIIFGQGAVRCHPHVLDEMKAVQAADSTALGQALLAHGRHVLRNFWHAMVGAPLVGQPPAGLGAQAQSIAHLSAQYSFIADLAMGVLGGELKRMELLSERLGDVLAHLYMASASVWRLQHERPAALLAIAQAAIEVQLHQGRQALQEICVNLPHPAARWLASLALRRGRRFGPVSDTRWLALAETLRTQPDIVRALCPDLATPASGGMLDLVQALELAEALGPQQVAQLVRQWREPPPPRGAPHAPLQTAQAKAFLQAVERVIAVDDVDSAAGSSRPMLRGSAAQ